MTTTMKKVIDIIRNRVNGQRERDAERTRERIRGEFKVVERHGAIWLTHDGRAFARIERNATADEIASLLTDARIAATTYEPR